MLQPQPPPLSDEIGLSRLEIGLSSDEIGLSITAKTSAPLEPLPAAESIATVVLLTMEVPLARFCSASSCCRLERFVFEKYSTKKLNHEWSWSLESTLSALV